MFPFKKVAGGVLVLALLVSAAEPAPFAVTPAVESALDRISEGSLRGNLSFLASDTLQGRDTPSPGLDVAAEFIAAQFRGAGLEPAGDDGYFQTAPFLSVTPRPESFEWQLRWRGKTIRLDVEDVAFPATPALNLRNTPAVKVALDAAPPADLAGRVVIADPGTGALSLSRVQALRARKAALVVALDRRGDVVRFAAENGIGSLVAEEERTGRSPWLLVRSAPLAVACDQGLDGATATVRLAAPAEKSVRLRNVAGLLRGSDPVLRDTYVLLTAHYDHVGVKPDCTAGDCIFNGANDDGSGTVSVIEIARALASLEPRPRRSIVFLAVFGEEKGLLGARYYARHPLFPLDRTIADVNLEQLGRTDATEGPQEGAATLTGFDYSDLPGTFEAAGRLTGIRVADTPSSGDFFARSDNVALALAGVPSHTLAVAYQYPDYHGLADTWDKIDYANMARVDRMVALGVLMLAQNSGAPQWNESQPKARRYAEARRQRRAD